LQWLDSLPKEVREQKLLEVMDLMADGTIKPPPPSEPFAPYTSNVCWTLNIAVVAVSQECPNSKYR